MDSRDKPGPRFMPHDRENSLLEESRLDIYCLFKVIGKK